MDDKKKLQCVEKKKKKKNTYRYGGWHLPQGVFAFVGQRLSAQQLPHRLGRGEEVDQVQEGPKRKVNTAAVREKKCICF